MTHTRQEQRAVRGVGGQRRDGPLVEAVPRKDVLADAELGAPRADGAVLRAWGLGLGWWW